MECPKTLSCYLSGLLLACTALGVPLAYGADVPDDYAFLLNLDPADAQPVATGSWDFTLELNDSGVDDDDELRQWLSAARTDFIAPLDFFALDVETDSFDRYHSINLQYDTAPIGGDSYLALQAFYSLDQIPVPDSSDRIDDVSQGIGVYWMWLQVTDPWLLNWGLGLRWHQIDTEDLLIYENQGTNEFLLPGLQLQWQREVPRHSIAGTLMYEWNEPSWVDTRDTSRTVMIPVTIGDNQVLVEAEGRLDIPRRFQVLYADYRHQWSPGPKNRPGSNGHWQFSLAWQTSLGEPLLPAFQRSIGGLHSVRGYDDQIAAGNEMLQASLEYHHRILGDRFADAAWQPWLIAFYDWAQVQSEALSGSLVLVQGGAERRFVLPESRQTLRSAGLAIDLHYRERSTLYLAVARALVDDGLDTEAGNWRVHGYLRFHF